MLRYPTNDMLETQGFGSLLRSNAGDVKSLKTFVWSPMTQVASQRERERERERKRDSKRKRRTAMLVWEQGWKKKTGLRGRYIEMLEVSKIQWPMINNTGSLGIWGLVASIHFYPSSVAGSFGQLHTIHRHAWSWFSTACNSAHRSLLGAAM